MKKFKMIAIAIVLLISFVFFGCIDNNGNLLDINDFKIMQSENFKELLYSFSPIAPAADSYILYYMEGEWGKYEVLAAGATLTVTSATDQAPGKVAGLKDNTTYSILVESRKDDNIIGESDVKQAKTRAAEPGTLNITILSDDEGKVIFKSHSAIVLSSTHTSETLDLSGNELTNIEWYLGNISLGTGETYTLEYEAFKNSGSYTLTIFFTKNGKRWSGNFTFTVIK